MISIRRQSKMKSEASRPKRSLPLEPSDEGHVTKRLRGAIVTDAAGLLRTTPGKESDDSDSNEGEDSPEATRPENESGQDPNTESETSSSGSEANDSLKDRSSAGDDEASSTASISTSSLNRNKPSEDAESCIQDLPLPRKPVISAPGQPSALQSRLCTFLPELRKANKDLEDPAAALTRRLDQVDDDEEHYIEMNLGLGVLKERPGRARADGIRLADGHDTSSDDEEEEEFDADTTDDGDQAGEQEVDTTRLMDLMGDKQATRETPSIQEVPGS